MSRIRFRAAALAAALTLLAGCAGARTPAPATAAAPRLAPATWDRSSSPDSIAAWALRGCGQAGAAKQTCFEEALISTIRPAGVDKAMAALERIVAVDADVARDTHVYAHGIGIAAYTDAATVGQTFSKCTPAFQSGCYHGVIQAFFADAGTSGVSAERLNALCADYRSPQGRWLQFQCAHGAGHGLMAIHGHHLVRALEACDVLTDMPERSACWGGPSWRTWSTPRARTTPPPRRSPRASTRGMGSRRAGGTRAAARPRRGTTTAPCGTSRSRRWIPRSRCTPAPSWRSGTGARAT